MVLAKILFLILVSFAVCLVSSSATLLVFRFVSSYGSFTAGIASLFAWIAVFGAGSRMLWSLAERLSRRASSN